MTQIEFIIKLFDHLGYQFIDERTIRNSHNELWYNNGNLLIDVNFKFETGEVTTIGESTYSTPESRPADGYGWKSGNLPIEFEFRGIMSEYLKRVPQDRLRDFKIQELVN